MTNWEKLVSKAEGGIYQLMCEGRACSSCALNVFCNTHFQSGSEEVNAWLAEEAEETLEEKIERLEKEAEELRKENRRLNNIIAGNNW